MKDILPSTKILGIKITTAPKNEILEYIFERLQNNQDKFYIVTPNPEMLVYATRSKEFEEVLNKASVSLPDGVGVLIAGKIQKKPIIHRITGVDFMFDLCRESAKRAITVGFLGGRGGVAEMTAECLREKYPDLRVNFVGEEWETGPAASHPHPTTSLNKVSLGRSTEDHRFASPVSRNHIDILFVAFGFPKQEEWIAKNLPNIDVTIALGVGGAFDYISGKVPRAPKIVRRTGLEWAFRLVRQPWRIKRQIMLPVFAWKVLKEKQTFTQFRNNNGS